MNYDPYEYPITYRMESYFKRIFSGEEISPRCKSAIEFMYLIEKHLGVEYEDTAVKPMLRSLKVCLIWHKNYQQRINLIRHFVLSTLKWSSNHGDDVINIWEGYVTAVMFESWAEDD